MDAARSGDETQGELLSLTREYLRQRFAGIDPESVLVRAWERFHQVYSQMIRRFAYSCGVAGSDLDDCQQEVWRAVLAELPRFEYDSNRGRFRSWLYQMVKRKAVDAARRRIRKPAVPLSSLSIRGWEPRGPVCDPSVALEQRWNEELLEVVLGELRSELSERSFRVLQMRSLEQRSVEETAAALALTPDQVRARHHRALRKLRVRMGLYAGQDFGGA